MPDRTQSQGETSRSSRIVLVDLSADYAAAVRWARTLSTGAEVSSINKTDLRWAGRLEALRRIRSLKPAIFALFSADMGLQSSRSAMMLFGAATGARRIVMGDAY